MTSDSINPLSGTPESSNPGPCFTKLVLKMDASLELTFLLECKHLKFKKRGKSKDTMHWWDYKLPVPLVSIFKKIAFHKLTFHLLQTQFSGTAI